MKHPTTRREFVKQSALTVASLSSVGYFSSVEAQESNSPNEKLNIAMIGVWGRGRADANGVRGENFYALCDIDERNYAKFIKQFPEAEKAKIENDWRKLLDDDKIDAVVIATADQVHALAAVKAMQLGKHVYCEKPLGHSVYEARRVREVYNANKAKLATQMGTQMHNHPLGNYRRVVELIQSGAIGPVKEAHVWCTRTIKPLPDTSEKQEIPDYLEWDLWLGPAPFRPYNAGFLPGNLCWNRWWDFGNGVLGDMGSHLIDLPWWALKLTAPLTVETEGPEPDPIKCPEWGHFQWEHAPRPGNEFLNRPVTIHWYHGGYEYCPKIDVGFKFQDRRYGNGILFVGDKGMLLADYGRRNLLPAEQYEDFTPPEKTIPDSPGHYKEWLDAAKAGGGETTCNFEYAGSLIEHNLLGNVAFRVGEKLTWDPKQLKATNCPAADQYLRPKMREGWTI